MKQKTVTMLDVYPSIARFIETYCKHCSKDCEAPSIEMFVCVLKKIDKMKGEKENERKRMYKQKSC